MNSQLLQSWGKRAFLGVAAVMASPAMALAEEAAAGDSAKPSLPQGPVAMVIASGTIGWIICLLSVVVVALIIEAFMSITREKLLPEEVLADIEANLDEGNYDGAIEICQSEDCMMTKIIGAGLNKMNMGVERMADAIAEEADGQATILNQKISYINLIAGVAPSMGLLGTVQGMIGAFGAIASNPSANASDLAAHIYVALMTTLEGLIVSIPAAVMFNVLRGKVVKILMTQSIINGEILDRFRGESQEA